MAKFEDKTGKRYGKLTVISRAENDKYGRARWRCKCDCGNEIVVDAGHLNQGNTKSCGCQNKFYTNNPQRTHGMTHTPEYTAWCDMKTRCYNPNSNRYKQYGGRGIKVCDRWLHSFENFFKDMGARPSNEYSLDRIDVDGNYEPNNCRWATEQQQANNKTTNRFLAYNNEEHTVSEWARIIGISPKLMQERISNGWTVEKCITYGKPKNNVLKARKSRRKTELVIHTYDDFKDEIIDVSELNSRSKNLIGERFGKLTVVALTKPIFSGKQKKLCWLCKCDCGNYHIARGDSLKNGHNTSCGCGSGRAEKSKTHGFSQRPEYRVWTNIKQWCNNPNHKRYYQYGGVGIKVCEEWENSFEQFLKDVGEKPLPYSEYKLSRHDLDGDFNKDNCYWTRK